MRHLAARRLALAVVSLVGPASASALTVVSPALELADDGAPDSYTGQYTLTIYQDAAQTNYTSIFFDYHANTQELVFRTALLDEGADWYFVATGESFSLSGIAVGDYTEFNGFNQAFALPHGEFYLGGTTGQGFTGSKPNRTVLSWAHFSASNSGITLLDDAVAYDAGSIQVGTLNATAIPEPASAALLVGFVSLGLLAALRRTHRARK